MKNNTLQPLKSNSSILGNRNQFSSARTFFKIFAFPLLFNKNGFSQDEVLQLKNNDFIELDRFNDKMNFCFLSINLFRGNTKAEYIAGFSNQNIQYFNSEKMIFFWRPESQLRFPNIEDLYAVLEFRNGTNFFVENYELGYNL